MSVEYGCMKKITDPELIRKIRLLDSNPKIKNRKDRFFAFYDILGIDIEWDDNYDYLFDEMEKLEMELEESLVT